MPELYAHEWFHPIREIDTLSSEIAERNKGFEKRGGVMAAPFEIAKRFIFVRIQQDPMRKQVRW